MASYLSSMPHGGFALRSSRVIAAVALLLAPSAIGLGLSSSWGSAVAADDPLSLPVCLDGAQPAQPSPSPTPAQTEPTAAPSAEPTSLSAEEQAASPSSQETPAISRAARSTETAPTSEPSSAPEISDAPEPTPYTTTSPSSPEGPSPSPTDSSTPNATPSATSSPTPTPTSSASPSATPSSVTPSPTATSLSCPLAPTNFAVFAQNRSILVSWSLPTGDSADAVQGFILRGPGAPQILDATARQAQVTGLRNGTPVTVSIESFNDSFRSEPVGPLEAVPTSGGIGDVVGLIVQYEEGTASLDASGDPVAADAAKQTAIESQRELGEDLHSVMLSEPVSLAEAQEIAAELTADPRIAVAEPDLLVGIASFPNETPDDPAYVDQWNLWGEYGIGLGSGPDAMSGVLTTTQGEDSVVAVIDTGVVDHPDLAGALLPGYDFVSDPNELAAPREENAAPSAFDADSDDTSRFGARGWDDNPRDPGDWRGVAPVRGSTWHGTGIAGVIAARADNAEGVVGIAPQSKVVPVRALSWRGGLLSDVAAGITWSSGGEVPGVPANANPADIINLSFSVQASCPRVLQEAIDGAVGRGAAVVVAAGNASQDVSGFTPANCRNVIAVGATGQDGRLANYSNRGAGIDLVAPGGAGAGAIRTASNSGARAPEQSDYRSMEGTSIAAAHVSGALALAHANETSTTGARLVEPLLARGVRALTAGNCSSGECGAGLLDARALLQVAGTPTVTAPAITPVFNVNAADQDPGNFVISGFGSSDTVLVSIGLVNPPSGTSFKLPTRTGLTPGYNYDLTNTAMTQVSFTGSQENANNALADMLITTGTTQGNVTIQVSATTSIANVYYNPINRHFYEYVAQEGITATNAFAGAAGKSRYGQTGYIVSIESEQENSFISGNINAQNVWIGGTDSAVEGDWAWHGGPDAGDVFWRGLAANATPAGSAQTYTSYLGSVTYAGWCTSEPNNVGDEDYSVTNYNGGTCWNDFSNSPGSTIKGYIVEYGNTTDPPYSDVGSASLTAQVATEVTATWSIPSTPNGNYAQTFTVQFSAAASGIESNDFSIGADSGAVTGCVFSPAASTIAANTPLTVSVFGCSAGNLRAQVNGSGISFTPTGVLESTPSSRVVVTSAGATPTYPSIGAAAAATGQVGVATSLGSFTLSDASCTVGQVKATVTAASGTLTATAQGSASVSGNSTGTLTISGSIAHVDSTLDTVRLTAPSEGAVTVTSTLVPAANSTIGSDTYLFNPTNGHYYLVTSPSSTTWLEAATNANSRTFCGVGGYFATITSSGENDFIRQQALTSPIGDIWIGGHKNSTWNWYPGPNGPVSEAGLAAYAQSGTPPWHAGEPNNSGSDMQIYYTGSPGSYGWDDTGGSRNQRWFVEFGTNASFTAPSATTLVTLTSASPTPTASPGGGGGGGEVEPTSPPTPTPTPTASPSVTASPTPSPTPTLSPSATRTPRPVREDPPQEVVAATTSESSPEPTDTVTTDEEEIGVLIEEELVEESPSPTLDASPSPAVTSEPQSTPQVEAQEVPVAVFDAQPPSGESLLTDTTPVGPVMNLRVDLQIGASVEGRSAIVEAAGLQPGSDVQVLLYSEPMVIGTGVADGAGNASIATQIPGGLPPGQHTIMAVGTGPSGDPVQSVGAFEITADEVVSRFVEPAQVSQPIDPEDPQIARALDAGKSLYDVALYPAVIATVAVAGAAVVGLAGAGGLTGTGSASGGRSSRGKLAGVVTKKLKALKAPEPGLGDRSRSWAMPGTRRTDAWIKELPKRAGKFSALMPRVLVDGAWSRAMFGSFGFILWGVGLALGLWSAWSTGFEALPPALPLMLAIIALGILDAAAGAIAWVTIVVGALVTGNLTTWPEIRTALGLFVIFASIPLLAHVIRPLRRRISGTGMELFDRVADYVMPPIFLAFAAASMFKALNGLSGLELVSSEDFGEVRIVVIVAFLMRMAMEDVATYAYPVRSSEVQPEKLVSPGKGLALLSVAIRVGVFLIIAEPFFGLGWATYLSAFLIAIPMALKVYEDDLPNLVWLNKWYPRGVANFALLLVVGIYVSFWLLGQDATDEQVRQTYNFILLPGIVSGLIQLVGREGGVWPENWWKRAIGFVVWLFAVGIVTGVIALT